MKNIVLALALCASVSLDGMHATRKLCKEIPQIIPAALKDLLAAFEREDQARNAALAAQSIIKKSSDPDEEVVKKLRVDLLPKLIVAAADTRSVLKKYSSVFLVSSSDYDKEKKSEEYINEFSPSAFGAEKGVMFYWYNEQFRAYIEYLKHLSKNPDVVKITELK